MYDDKLTDFRQLKIFINQSFKVYTLLFNPGTYLIQKDVKNF